MRLSRRSKRLINETDPFFDGTEEQHGEWIELYSTGRYPVDLDGFQIEVGDVDFSPVYTLTNVSLHAGQALLLGGSNVVGRDQGPDDGFGMPNRGFEGPTAGVRLVATNEGLRVVDCLMYGGSYPNFDPGELDTTGWISETAYYAAAGSSLFRWFPGHDTDQAGDWHWTNSPTPTNINAVIDTDGDGLTDEQELTGILNNGEPTDPYNPDSDGDGLSDFAECVTHHTNPNAWATDGDLFPWAPASGGVTNWPGSDSYELTHDWNPHVADQNANGTLDSWEMAFPGTNLYDDTDHDGVTNLFEIQQNSNPYDSNSFVEAAYSLQFESSKSGWANNGRTDVGLKGWVKVNFPGILTNVDVCLWIVEGSNAEPFTVTWSGVANGTVTMVDDQHAIATASLSPGTKPSLLMQDNGAHPNYTNTLGGEYKIDILKVEITEPNGNSAGDNQFVFAGLPAMRRCNVPSVGTTHVSGQETNLVWTIDSIPDTILSSSPTPAGGPNVTFTYTGEPAHNSDFVPQRQLILAHSLIPNCQATTNLQFFFDAEYANIHEPAVNWFVYWKQDGVVADLQQFQYESIIPGLTGEYGAYDANDDICYISPDAYSWAGHQSYSVTNSTGGVVVIGLDLGADYGPTNRLIAVASVCAHELKHKEIHGWLIADPVDSDSDGIPDAKEIALGLDPNTNDTYNVAGAIDPSYAPYGDGEFLARQAEIYFGTVTPTNDWSSNGCNWRQ